MSTESDELEGYREPPALRRNEWDHRAPTTRAEMAAQKITAIAGSLESGTRLGTKEELRIECGVSVGTLNEALRLLQARGLVTVRPGPGGGLFAARPSPMVRLGNSVLALDSDQAAVTDAVRVRNALEPLLIEDALWHASPADIAGMRDRIAAMATAAEAGDGTAFIRANWALHARIAAVTPNTILRSIYLSVLELIEAHTLAVVPVAEQSLPEFLHERHRLHSALVDAIAARDSGRALELVTEHNARLQNPS